MLVHSTSCSQNLTHDPVESLRAVGAQDGRKLIDEDPRLACRLLGGGDQENPWLSFFRDRRFSLKAN